MTGRMIEEAERRLRQLRQDEWSRLVLAGLAGVLATMESRRLLAEAVRSRLEPAPGYRIRERVAAVAEELELLSCELEDDRLVLDPSCAVRCAELVTDYADSPLLNDLLPAADVGSQLRQIHAGFSPRPGA
jgi:hypothetical protein